MTITPAADKVLPIKGDMSWPRWFKTNPEGFVIEYTSEKVGVVQNGPLAGFKSDYTATETSANMIELTPQEAAEILGGKE